MASDPASIQPAVASQLFLRHISAAVSASQSCCDCKGKSHLWMAMLSMVVNQTEYRVRSALLGFISYEPRTIICDHGVAVITVFNHQVSINALVPMRPETMSKLYDHVADHIRNTWYDYAVDLRALHNFVKLPPPDKSHRRFVPSRRYARVLQYIDGMVECLSYHTPVESVVTNPRDLSNFTPITRMNVSDPMDTLYWHRFSCGTIVTFKNPPMDMQPVLELPPFIDNGVVINTLLTPCCKKYVKAMTPSSLQQCLDLLESDWIPLEQRRFLAVTTKVHFGVRDVVILATGQLLGCDPTKLNIVTEMCMMYQCIKEMATTKPANRIADAMFDTIASFGDQAAWRRWMLESEFVYAVVDKVTPEHMERLCHRHNHLYYVLAFLLLHQTGDWSHDMRRKAYIVAQSGIPVADISTDPIEEIRTRVQKLTVETTSKTMELIAQDSPTPSSAGRAKSRRRTARRPSRETSTTATPSSFPLVTLLQTPQLPTSAIKTMHSLTKSFGSCILGDRYECTLIGSGIFHNGSDADIVVCIPHHDNLHSAYEELWSLLRNDADGEWTPQYDQVSNDHVAVIRGTFEGTSIDLQVWRGDRSDTPAETMTQRAITLSKSLSLGTTDEHRRHVAILHEFAIASSWKGHRLCRLPGIALTCLAIVVGRGGIGLTTSSLLGRVRDAIAQDSPVVDFDELEYVRRSLERPSSALTIIVNEINIATRLTVATTRHLVDTLAFTMERGIILSQADYDAWRRRSMIVCLSIEPRNASRTIPMTLHSSIARMDGHPLIDTVFVGERGDGTVLDIYVTIASSADTERYGFKDTDVVCAPDTESSSAPAVTVSRRGRRWRLCAKAQGDHAGELVTMSNRHSVTNMISVPESSLCIPNAPHLTMDVTACFDAQHWIVLM